MTKKIDINHVMIRLIKKRGVINVSLADVCEAAGISPGSFSNIMGCTFTECLLEYAAAGETGAPEPVEKSRNDPKLLRLHLINIATEIARERGYKTVMRLELAERANVSPLTVRRIFPDVADLRAGIMDNALRREIPSIIAQGLAVRDKIALKASAKLKARAAAYIGG